MKILVLLSTYNGKEYLSEQIESLLSQTFSEIGILIRDDGSTDGTRSVLARYHENKQINCYAGDNIGFAKSMWNLIQICDNADYYAFCDQDDIWDANKLEVAVNSLKDIDSSIPSLYCGNVRVTDFSLKNLKSSVVRQEPVDYLHALIRNHSPGCTYVFNRSALELLRRFDVNKLGIELHDWTAYQIISCFGKVIYDPVAYMSYRQHSRNAIGTHPATIKSLCKKISSFWSGSMKNSREKQAKRLEQAYGKYMNDENRELTSCFAHYRTDREKKLKLLRNQKIKLGFMDKLMFKMLVLFNRL